MPLSEGTRLGPYEILTLIGVGGMGEVYRGRDTRLNRAVAIKVISPRLAADPHFRDRFDREAMTVSQLNHPNVCTLFDVGHHDGVDFLVMELVEGQTLAEHLAAGPLPTDRVLDIAHQMAQALAHAHELGIVHRDVKPQNVMLTGSGAVKILDFGLAKSEHPGSSARDEIAIGTIGYMAPEQLLEDGEIGPETDVWGLGIVLYEMLAGTRPFVAKDAVSLFKGIVQDAPESVKEKRADVPPQVDRLIRRALEKDPDRRHASAGEFASELAACRAVTTAASAGRRRLLTPWRAAAAGAIILLGAVFGVRAFNEEREIRRARQQALPEIERLLQQDRYFAAFTVAREAERHLGDDPALARVWPLVSVAGSLATEPAGADVSFKPYDDVSGEWMPLGRTPVANVRLPRGAFRFRVEKQGYAPVYFARALTSAFQPLTLVLKPAGADDDMVLVDGEAVPVNLSGFNTETLVTLGEFAIDRTEVTNAAFKQFVDAGGYTQADLWPDGRERISSFVDSTGRPGPAQWKLGSFLPASADEPVAGVTWFEAAAYCAFRGKQLPTVFHWSRAALAPREITAPLGPSIVPLSNFGGKGVAQVGAFAGMGPYGTVDMAGNVREWIWNMSAEDRRWILGGAYDDPDYMFSVPFSLPAGDRSPTNGFRCMKAASAPLPEHLLARVELSSQDYRGARPVTDEVFSVFVKQFAYVPSAGGGRTDAAETLPTGSLRERATVDAGYDKEELTIYVFTPPGGTPPYQALVYFPALNAFQSGAPSRTFYPADYVVKSGRAVVLPVLKGSFERWDATMGLAGEEYRRALRLRLLHWRQDVGRTIDYLATRGDIDMQRIGYYGRSFGASVPLALLSLEPRFRLAILHSGGLTYRTLPPEVDPVNYLPRVRLPTLMLTGRHDYVLPFETSQKPLFDLLGTPTVDRKHVIFDAGHDPLPRNASIREILEWLDRFFGVPPAPQPDDATAGP